MHAICRARTFCSCGSCGTALKGAERKFCPRKYTLQRDIKERRPIQLAKAKLAELKGKGRDPGHGGEAAKRGAKVAESNRRRAKYITADDKRLANNAKARRYREKVRAAAY